MKQTAVGNFLTDVSQAETASTVRMASAPVKMSLVSVLIEGACAIRLGLLLVGKIRIFF